MAEMTNTPDKRASELKGFKRLQKKQGGVKPSRVANGTELLIETKDYVYEIKVKDTVVGRRFLLDTAAPSCRDKNSITHIIAHSTKLKYDIDDWIGKGMRLIFKFTDGTSIMIGEVRGLTLNGLDQSGNQFRFDFWER